MTERTIDARGLLCPKPLMMTKKALDEAAVGTRLIILLDNDMACANVSRFLQDNGAAPFVSQEGKLLTINAEKRLESVSTPSAELSCAPGPARAVGPTVVAFSHDTMGHGSEELGRILVQACINTLPSLANRPDVIIFYNSGIHLTITGSPVLDTLRAMAGQGTKILVCGTCLDYYQVKDQLQVGTISNMFEILEHLTGAGKIINP